MIGPLSYLCDVFSVLVSLFSTVGEQGLDAQKLKFPFVWRMCLLV
jgi:hypothetical protein